ncbi:chaperonin 10-like protein [Bombardia bombarda]|uniref:Chaperonin 10-like protein n=1 Tax=Bombardia bombarda TaxID=252184 RepID=A0AA40C1G6_9PEZI|nr:chaperonin 10-like protein [Bombardia bombarda]
MGSYLSSTTTPKTHRALELLIKLTAASLNPFDQKCRDLGLLIADRLPAVLGGDIVGTVVAVGSDIPASSGFAVGTRVVSQATGTPTSAQNGLQEYALADWPFAVGKVPDGVSDEAAATLPTAIVASLVGIFDALGIPAPWIEDGEAEAEAEAEAGFDYEGTTLIVVVGGDEEELKGLGATHVLDRFGGDEAVLGRIREVVGDELVYAFDTVNYPAGQVLALNALSGKKKGRLARLLSGKVDGDKVVGKEKGWELKDVFGSSHAHVELAKGFWERLPGWLEGGEIKTLGYVVKEGLDAEVVSGVLDAYRDGERVPKTVVRF